MNRLAGTDSSTMPGERPADEGGIWRQPKAVWAVAFACVIAFMGLVDPILPAIAKQLHATPSQVELLFSSYFLLTGVSMIVTGVVSSRLGHKRTLLVGLGLIVAFSALAGSSGGIAEILAPRSLGTLLFAHHNPSWRLGFERERELQAVAASHLVEDLLGKREVSHVVLAGDFNAAPDSASVRFWRGLQSLGEKSVCYRDAWESAHPVDPGHTFSPRNPLVVSGGNWPLESGRRIDYVMVRCGDHGPTLEVTACERIFDKPVDGVWASDHFGVVADLAIPELSPAVHY